MPSMLNGKSLIRGWAVPALLILGFNGLACDDQGCALTDHSLDGAPTDDPASAVLTSTRKPGRSMSWWSVTGPRVAVP